MIKRYGCTFVRIVRSSLGTEYSIQVVYERPEAPENSCADTPMAVDLGCKAIATLADGKSYAPIKKSEPRRDAVRRRAAKTKKGTRLRRKRFGAWRKEAERVVRRNRRYRHEVAADVVKRSANLFLEDLKVGRMTRAGGSRKTGLNRSNARARAVRIGAAVEVQIRFAWRQGGAGSAERHNAEMQRLPSQAGGKATPG